MSEERNEANMDTINLDKTKCERCRNHFPNNGVDGMLCPGCSSIFPGSLVKAFSDPFQYAMKLRTGEIILFHYAEVGPGDFIRLMPGGFETFNPAMPPCPRGLDVRIADIVWCADAPEGS